MIRLAVEIRDRLTENMSNYPKLHYHHDPDALLEELTEHYQEGTDYTITFGHILAQSHSKSDIAEFTQIIHHIREMMDSQSHCALIAVDARGWSSDFARGWNSLLNSLYDIGVRNEECPVPETPINDSKRAKFAWIHAK